MISAIVNTRVGCNIGGTFINILAYADDMVILAPSWYGLQFLLDILGKAAADISMSFNTKKTVCMVFTPKSKNKVISSTFPALSLAGSHLSFVDQLKYLGHIIDSKLCDINDMKREIKCLFTRTNILLRRFKNCSTKVKITLFKSHCMCFYGIALWSNYTASMLDRIVSCFIKCLKMFFGYPKFSSVTNMFMELQLPTFHTVLYNYKIGFSWQCKNSNNRLVGLF